MAVLTALFFVAEMNSDGIVEQAAGPRGGPPIFYCSYPAIKNRGETSRGYCQPIVCC